MKFIQALILIFFGAYLLTGILQFFSLPVKYVSYSTYKCQYVENRGNKLPCSSLDPTDKYIHVWVK